MRERTARKRGGRATIIYDGKCPLCSETVHWLREKGLAGAFELLECQSEQRRLMHPEVIRADCMRAMHLVLSDGTVLAGEKALPEIIARLRGYRLAAPLFRLPGVGGLSRLAYRWFAERRYRIAVIMSHFAGGRKRGTKQRGRRSRALPAGQGRGEISRGDA
ncbi:MAG: thiol-disulfide oxidoreductase DCC family protein [Nitrospirota bacterium]